jgi:hypothetical protein
MTFYPLVNKSRLLSYEDFYKAAEPKNIKEFEYRVHGLVGRLIHVQFETVQEFDDIRKICRETDDLIRELKAEFDCVNIKLNDQDYPKFIRKLESYKVYAELDDYHSHIIQLLKILLFRIGRSDAKRDIENQFKEIIIELIYKHEPPKKLKPLFKDKKSFKKATDSIGISNADDKARKLLRELVDIEIDG